MAAWMNPTPRCSSRRKVRRALPRARPPLRYTRELTALVLAPIGIYITIWGHAYLFDATVAAIAALALHEFLILGRRKGYDIPVIICVLLMLFIIAAFVMEPISVEMGVFLT